MSIVFRLLVTLFVIPAVYYFVYWLPGSFLFLAFPQVPWLQPVVSSVSTAVVGWYIWRRPASVNPGLISSILLGAIVVGAIGFSAGFFGPLLLTPGSNQGPLLGIIITGPLGLVLGGIGGAIYWFRKRRKPIVN